MSTSSETVTIPRAEYEELKAAGALLERFVEPCTKAAQGDLECRLLLTGEEPERWATAGQALNALLDQVDAFSREAVASLRFASEGRFFRRFLVRGMHGTFRAAAEHINRAVARMATQAVDLKRSEQRRLADAQQADLLLLKNVVSVSMSTTDMTVGAAQILSASTESQLAASTMASAVEELAASIRDIERSAQESAETTGRAKEVTASGQRVVDELTTSVHSTEAAFDLMAQRTKSVESRVAALGGVVEVISKIAEQTNLLALNATIEAARAGELGKGFGVVASEVKALSRQTRAATDSIRDQIEALSQAFQEMYERVDQSKEEVHKVQRGVVAVGQGFGEMNEAATNISGQAASLASILTQQRAAVESLAQNMTTMKLTGDRTLAGARRLDERGRENLTLVEGWRADRANVDVPHRDVYLAKADHTLWKKTVIDFALGHSRDLSALKDDTQCRLAAWLARPENERFRALLKDPHRRVHAAGIAAARAFFEHHAETGFQHYAELEQASGEVIRILDTILAQLDGSASARPLAA